MKIFAHRGARGYAPENTLSAFKKAHALHADGIELDVQLPKMALLSSAMIIALIAPATDTAGSVILR